MRSDRLLLPFAMVPAATVLLPTPGALADAEIRFLQATPGAEPASLTIISGDTTFRTKPTGFGTFSTRVAVPAGSVDLRHSAPGTRRPAMVRMTLENHRRYTVVAAGEPERPSLELRADGSAQKGQARVRVAHFAPELGAPDLFVDGERVVQRFAYLDTTPYLALAPGRHELAAKRPNADSTLVSTQVRLRSGTTSTVYVLGSGGQATKALVASDAASPTTSTTGGHSSSRSANRTGGGANARVVRPGDTLWGIARDRLGADASETDVYYEVQRLWKLNGAHIPSGDPDVILPGQRINLR